MARKILLKDDGLQNSNSPVGFKFLGLNGGDLGVKEGGEVNKIVGDLNSYITDQEFYQFGDKQLIPDYYYYGQFEKNEEAYHLVSMREITDNTFQDAGREGFGLYLATFREQGSKLIIVDIVDIQENYPISELIFAGTSKAYNGTLYSDDDFIYIDGLPLDTQYFDTDEDILLYFPWVNREYLIIKPISVVEGENSLRINFTPTAELESYLYQEAYIFTPTLGGNGNYEIPILENNFYDFSNSVNSTSRLINGKSGGVNFLFYDYIEISETKKNTFLSFDVDVNDLGEISITNFTDRKPDDEDADNWSNILTGYDSFRTVSETYYGKETTFDSPEIFYLITEYTVSDVLKFDLLSYDIKTNTLTVMVQDFENWWGENSDVPYENITVFGSRIVVHNNKVVLWIGDNAYVNDGYVDLFNLNSYIVEFNPNRVIALNTPLLDYSFPVISKDKIYFVTVLQ
jgi:hypothetical protein